MFLPVPAPKEMGQWDSRAIELGMPEAVLMENAAREAFGVLRRHYGPLAGALVLVVCGGGNNGGDGVCLARHLADAGAAPFVLLTKRPDADKQAALMYLALLETLAIPHAFLPTEPEGADPDGVDLTALVGGVPNIVVDGLLGTGFDKSLRPREARLVEAMNRLAESSFVLALDVPSGLNALDGTPCPDAVHADVTVTFQAAKPGLVLPHSRRYTGLVEVRPIGIPGRVTRELPPSYRLWVDQVDGLSEAYVIGRDAVHFSCGEPVGLAPHGGNEPEQGDTFLHRRLRPFTRLGPQHKGESGRVLIIGGSPGLSGAPRLAAMGAIRGGAGLVCVAGPEAVMGDIRQSLPEAITFGFGTKRGTGDHVWPGELPEELRDIILRYDALVVGPGMGRNNGAEDFLDVLLRLENRPPTVLDADALIAMARKSSLLSLLRPSDLLTPHPGEAGALLGRSTEEVQAARLDASRKLTRLTDAVWVLKGAGSMVCAAGKPTTLSPLDVPTLAVGGSGDVLAGLAGALVAAGYHPEYAAVMAVRMHALAGLYLEGSFPLRGNSPQEIANALPRMAGWMTDPFHE